jgi:hypothetical protein
MRAGISWRNIRADEFSSHQDAQKHEESLSAPSLAYSRKLARDSQRKPPQAIYGRLVCIVIYNIAVSMEKVIIGPAEKVPDRVL